MGNFLKTVQGKAMLVAFPLALIVLVAAAVWIGGEAIPRTQAESPTENSVTFDLERNSVYTADDGIVVIPAAVQNTAPELPESVPLSVPASYTLPERAQLPDESIGLLTIPKLNLSVGVFESDSVMEAMTRGVAHFKITSAWQGNIGLCSHNVNFDLTDGYFKNIHALVEGDILTYKTAQGERTYSVTTIKEIAETDWSYLGRTEDNRITMITCISGKPTMRLVVQAIEKN